jgi:hypothetical protein
MAVARVPRPRTSAGRKAPGLAGATATVGRVTLVMPAEALDAGTGPSPRLPDGVYAGILAAAHRARDDADRRAEADRQAPGGCAHTIATASYRPPGRVRDLVVVRDQTCRQPGCGQPAWRTDLDHTTPHDQGGRTCPCNLGPLCRRHHQLKQHPRWNLAQPRPGEFLWTTPAGRTYRVFPHGYL